VAYQDTILMFHRARILEHCKAANCIIEGNPLHNEQTEIVRAIGGVVAVNVVIDEERRLGFVNFGEVETSHARAVEFMRKYAEIRIPRRFKTIVTTSAGYPLDKTYYQTVKGMVGVMDILEPGGTIIIASECSEGMGSREFAEAQQLLCQVGPERFMNMLEGRDKALIDEWETEMLLKPLRVGNIQLYSTGLSESDRKHVFVETVPSVEAAVAASIETQGDAEVAVVPEGPYVIPLYGGDNLGE
jgi:nickel-dependent lactate racemase